MARRDAPRLDPQEQRRYFRAFCENEIAAGGPDPHMKTVAAMSAGLPWAERVWHGGVYAGVYNVPSAEFIWQEWPADRVDQARPGALEDWLRANWGAIVTRRERRCVRRPEQLAAYLLSFVAWLKGLGEDWSRYPNYDALWAAMDNVYTAGRYYRIKLFQYLRLAAEFPEGLSDLRPAGGENPRLGLALLVEPEDAALLLGADESPEAHARMNEVFFRTQAELAQAGLSLDGFHYQTLLCDYKQCYIGKRQYPGRSLDSELSYFGKIEPALPPGYATAMFSARARLFPSTGLGETQGWRGVREELGAVLRDFGYMWSDAQYDYCATTFLGQPVKRAP